MSRITFLTPTRNRPLSVLERCLASVDRQTFSDWEHLVCSDGPPEPGVKELVERPSDGRRYYVYLAEPAGHFGAGVRAALLPQVSSDYVAFLDDDNLLFPRYGERMVRALDEHPEAGFVICPIVHCGPLLPCFGPPPAILTGVPPVLNNIDTLQVVVRTQVIRECGWALAGYGSDGWTYERLSQQVGWVAVEEVLAIHL
jgi:glycosyltransferase involved in cell wall biosynthesis